MRNRNLPEELPERIRITSNGYIVPHDTPDGEVGARSFTVYIRQDVAEAEMREGEAVALIRKLLACGAWFPSAIELDFHAGGTNGEDLLAEAERILASKDVARSDADLCAYVAQLPLAARAPHGLVTVVEAAAGRILALANPTVDGEGAP